GLIDLRAFYLRRALRLLPALGVLLVVTLALAFVGAGVSDPDTALRGALYAALYVTDFVVGFGGEFAPELAHLWTLGVEEQFYVVWPALLVLLVIRNRPEALLRWVGWLVALGVVARLLTMGLAWRHGWFFYALPTTWLDCFMAGAMLAVWMESRGRSRPAPRWTGRFVTGLAITTTLAIALSPGAFLSPVTYIIGIPALTASTVCLIGRAVLRPGGVLHRFLGLAWLQWLGDRSYGLYLFNSAFVLMMVAWLGPGLAARSAGMGVAIVSAELSRRYVERPALELKSRIRRRSSSAASLEPAP
ncbi:MAG TPA: acyltransferase, partial [Devosia sp.]|nr:acyltransferase [Devosia sp.]